MLVLRGIEGGVIRNASRQRAIQVAHGLGEVGPVAHLVGDILQLGAKTEAAQGLHASIERLDRTGGWGNHAVDPGGRLE